MRQHLAVDADADLVAGPAQVGTGEETPALGAGQNLPREPRDARRVRRRQAELGRRALRRRPRDLPGLLQRRRSTIRAAGARPGRGASPRLRRLRRRRRLGPRRASRAASAAARAARSRAARAASLGAGRRGAPRRRQRLHALPPARRVVVAAKRLGVAEDEAFARARHRDVEAVQFLATPRRLLARHQRGERTAARDSAADEGAAPRHRRGRPASRRAASRCRPAARSGSASMTNTTRASSPLAPWTVSSCTASASHRRGDLQRAAAQARARSRRASRSAPPSSASAWPSSASIVASAARRRSRRHARRRHGRAHRPRRRCGRAGRAAAGAPPPRASAASSVRARVAAPG